MTSTESARRRALTANINDTFRSQLPFVTGGRVMLTSGVAALPPDRLLRVMQTVRNFSDFTSSNDPWREHDCATFQDDGDTFIWKIDYYENDSCEYGAEDSSVNCFRVLTLMFAQER